MVEGARLESEYTAKPYRGFESLPLRHFGTELGTCPDKVPAYTSMTAISRLLFDPMISFASIDLVALGQCAKMVAAVATTVYQHPFASGAGEFADHLRCD